MLKKSLIILTLLFTSSPSFGKEINDFLHDPTPVSNIQFTDDQKVIHNLNDYLGKVVLLNFWATWCKPCANEMPSLSRLQENLTGHDVVLIALSLDYQGLAEVKDFYKKHEISNMRIFLDQKGQSFKAFKLGALPTTIVIDKSGKEVARVLGEIEWDSKEVKDYLVKLTKQ
ncbi:MAG: hypothetical protein K0R98_1746 [Rickettsiaceae bacterium]|jgi:thiol-disulfide isomerase/thioredoxin|nr:hypothetical protein [Rickettsiaceae bacterium]